MTFKACFEICDILSVCNANEPFAASQSIVVARILSVGALFFPKTLMTFSIFSRRPQNTR